MIKLGNNVRIETDLSKVNAWCNDFTKRLTKDAFDDEMDRVYSTQVWGHRFFWWCFIEDCRGSMTTNTLTHYKSFVSHLAEMQSSGDVKAVLPELYKDAINLSRGYFPVEEVLAFLSVSAPIEWNYSCGDWYSWRFSVYLSDWLYAITAHPLWKPSLQEVRFLTSIRQITRTLWKTWYDSCHEGITRDYYPWYIIERIQEEFSDNV